MKRHQLSVPAIALAMLGVAGSAVAQQTSATIEVRGEITPPACDIRFPSGDTLTFTRAFNALDAGGTKLESQTTEMSVSCEAPTRVAVKLTDAKADSKIAFGDVTSTTWGNPTAAGYGAGFIFGLGTTPDTDGEPKKIGGFMIQAINGTATVDNAAGKIAALQSNNTHYYHSANDHINTTLVTEYSSMTNGYTFYQGSWRASGTVPVAFKDATTMLTVTPTIAKPTTLPASDEIQLDGMVNFELRYL
ncbi:DUF1120 domain-containing protein [Burkholderia sp. 572]|uniref:DUF1120 domain-containing protein n=1 Tax=Burkholderia sp. 572 TaxID=3156414 RepID=UPI00339848B9